MARKAKNYTIKPDALATTIEAILAETQQEVNANVREILEENATQGVKSLKATSPKRTGEYAKGWDVEKTLTVDGYTWRIYNSDRYQITHLLENGHLNRNGLRTAPTKHIKPVEQQLIRDITNKIQRLKL